MEILELMVVAHIPEVTSSRQITEVKQRQARLVFGWVTGAPVTMPAMCRSIGQASHIMLLLPLPLPLPLPHPAVMGVTGRNSKLHVSTQSCFITRSTYNTRKEIPFSNCSYNT